MRHGPALAPTHSYREFGFRPESRCAIWEPIPGFRDVLARTAEQAGLVVTVVDGLADAQTVGPDLVVTYVDARLIPLCSEIISARTQLIAVLDSYSEVTRHTLLGIGVAAIIERCAPESHVELALCAWRQGLSVVPRTATQPDARRAPLLRLAAEELEWLTSAANGATVAEIAARVGHSERTLQRRLRGLYAELGVRDLTHALVIAASMGLIAPGF